MSCRIVSLCSAVVAVILLTTVAAVGAPASSVVPTEDSCGDECFMLMPSGESMDGADGSQPGDWEPSCVMDPGCGGGQAHAHGASGLVAATAARFLLAEPAVLAVGVVVSRAGLPGRLTPMRSAPVGRRRG